MEYKTILHWYEIWFDKHDNNFKSSSKPLFAWQFQFMRMAVYAWTFYKISGAQFMM